MKKQLLLSVFTVGALLASAQGTVTTATPQRVTLSRELKSVEKSLRVKGSPVTSGPNYASSNAKLSYQRPCGQFYFFPLTLNSGNSTYYGGGGMFLNPYTPLQFNNLSSMSNSNNYKWKWNYYDQDAQGWVEADESNPDGVTISFINNYLPGSLELTYSAFSFGGVAYRWEQTKYSEFHMNFFPTSNLTNMFDAFGDDLASGFYKDDVMPVSSKYFGLGTREKDQSNTTGWWYYTIQGRDNACWFGSGSDYSATATRFEKPDKPYVIKGVYLWGHWGPTTGTVELPVKIYKVLENAYFNEEEKTNYPAVLGDLIIEGKATIIPGESADTPNSGFLTCKFYETDGVGTYEVQPEISDEIVVVVEDINNPNITFGTFVVSGDSYDEGYGELGYLGYSSTENPTDDKPQLFGLTHFFNGDPMHTAPSILLDVERGWIMNAEDNGDEWAASATGETKELILRSFEPSEGGMNWEPTLEDGEELPEWLAINLEDYYEGEDYRGLVIAELTVDALPSDVSYREAKVKFAYPGASYIYTVKQGDSGAVEIVGENGEIVANKYFDLQGREVKNVPENGIFIQKSTLSDGSVKAVKVIR